MNTGMKSDLPATASVHILWNRLPRPLAVVSRIISLPGSSGTVWPRPAMICWALGQNATSEPCRYCTVSERPAFFEPAVATL
ncbi:hypothetical protein D3C84_824230 [compost metagenome]